MILCATEGILSMERASEAQSDFLTEWRPVTLIDPESDRRSECRDSSTQLRVAQ